MNETRIQSVFSASAVTAEQLASNPPPMCPGDRIEGATVHFVTDASDNLNSPPALTLEIWACNSPPGSPTAARNGRPVLPPLVLPFVPNLVDATGDLSISGLTLTIPLWDTLDTHEMHVAVVLTCTAAATGAVFLRASRPDRPRRLDPVGVQ